MDAPKLWDAWFLPFMSVFKNRTDVPLDVSIRFFCSHEFLTLPCLPEVSVYSTNIQGEWREEMGGWSNCTQPWPFVSTSFNQTFFKKWGLWGVDPCGLWQTEMQRCLCVSVFVGVHSWVLLGDFQTASVTASGLWNKVFLLFLKE